MTITTTTLYCYVHPGRETTLRCNRCERPICSSCAVRTPTGYRCKDCVRAIQKTFDNAVWYDYLIGFTAAAFLSLIASIVVNLISGFIFGLFVLLLAPTAGAIIARGVQAVLRRRRARALFRVCAAGVVAGALPLILIWLLPPLLSLLSGNMRATLYSLLPLVWQIVYLFIATPMVYARLSGIQFSK